MAPTASAARALPAPRTHVSHTAERPPRISVDRPVRTSFRPRLTVVARPHPRSSSLPFAILCTLVIVATLVAVLMLNISMSDTSYRISRLHAQSQQLNMKKQNLAERNEQLSTPQELERRATAMGMVPASSPAYIDLASGKVVGNPQPAGGTAAQPQQAPVPVAQIYDKSDVYYGMGNEGH